MLRTDVLDVTDKILVYENKELEDKLEQSLREHFAKSFRPLGGKQTHVSSLTYCLRQQAIKTYLVATKQNEPIDFIDIWTAMNFIRGLVSEYALTKVLKTEIDPQKDLDFEEKIVAHPDGVTKDNKTIIEMKNSNSYEALAFGDDALYSYMRQTVYYMIMSGIEVGHIIMIYGLPLHLKWTHSDKGIPYYRGQAFKKNKIRPFKIFTLNLKKHSSLRNKIKDSMRLGHNYISSQDYQTEDVIKRFPRLDNYPDSVKCKYCEVQKQCKDIEPEIDHNVNLVDSLLNKLIDDNLVNISK